MILRLDDVGHNNIVLPIFGSEINSLKVKQWETQWSKTKLNRIRSKVESSLNLNVSGSDFKSDMSLYFQQADTLTKRSIIPTDSNSLMTQSLHNEIMLLFFWYHVWYSFADKFAECEALLREAHDG